MPRFSLRIPSVVLLTGAAGVCFTGYVCNAWAAWAPAGADNPNHARLVAGSLMYRDLAFGCISFAIGTVLLPSRRAKHREKEDSPAFRQVLSGLFIGALMFVGAFFGLTWTNTIYYLPDPGPILYRHAHFGAVLGGAMAIGLKLWWTGQKYGYALLAAIAVIVLFIIKENFFYK
jgi:hypothetical protein